MVSDIIEARAKLETYFNISNALIEVPDYCNKYLLDLKNYDIDTYKHSLRVGIIMAELINNNSLYTYNIVGALLHDIGKIKVPIEILNKPDKLTEQEKEIMDTHTKEGYKLIANDKNISDISRKLILLHHTKDINDLDLNKLRMADVLDALVSDRPYRLGMSLDSAIEILEDEFKDLSNLIKDKIRL